MILTKWEYILFTNCYIHHIVPHNQSQALKFSYQMNNFELMYTYILDATIHWSFSYLLFKNDFWVELELCEYDLEGSNAFSAVILLHCNCDNDQIALQIFQEIHWNTDRMNDRQVKNLRWNENAFQHHSQIFTGMHKWRYLKNLK
jgi:hypothetical protein